MGATRQEDTHQPPETPLPLSLSHRSLPSSSSSFSDADPFLPYYLSRNHDNHVITRAINQLKTTKVTTPHPPRIPWRARVTTKYSRRPCPRWSTFQDFTTTMGLKLRLSGWRARFVPNERIFPLFSWAGAGCVEGRCKIGPRSESRLDNLLDFYI